ncbi:hypothetical protein [Thiocystis minor]|uniref:hypothetical protein n=1 Tax=Thiocystis minor TaxID=61597 RepID=UPI0019148B46|nr:hypothetical protein [Thiocystis minor]
MLRRRVESLERQAQPEDTLPSLAQALLAARGQPLGPVSEALTPEIAAARERVHQMRAGAECKPAP